METETLVTQFTCDRGGMICSRPRRTPEENVSRDLRKDMPPIV